MSLQTELIKNGDLAVVIGAAASGLAAARLLTLLGAKVRVLDKKGAYSQDFTAAAKEGGWELRSGEHSPADFHGAALVVPSPGVPVKVFEPLLARAALPNGPRWVSELELASRFAHDKGERVIAITGTSGKTTTSSLIAAMLQEAGKRVFLGGNIGTPLADYVVWRETGRMRPADFLVLEVSSFQLQGIKTFHPEVGLLLNLSENHLDQHKDMAEYIEAKFGLFRNQENIDLAIFGNEPPFLDKEVAARSFRAKVEFFRDKGNFKKSRLLGLHNRLNMEAAWLAVRRFGVTLEQAQQAAENFAPMPHRLESVAEIDGVTYVNDSKCTTVAALRVALESFITEESVTPVLLLAGGVFKGGDLASLRPLLERGVKAVGLFGGNREKFEEAWQGTAPLGWDEKMSEAVQRLRKLAAPGDVVLLAPATSSYDQYNNYKERGQDFINIVRQLG